jgi:hypothetical protein
MGDKEFFEKLTKKQEEMMKALEANKIVLAAMKAMEAVQTCFEQRLDRLEKEIEKLKSEKLKEAK